MQKYKVVWEVSKYAFVDAENEEDAITKVMETDIEQFEKEITMSPEVYKAVY